MTNSRRKGKRGERELARTLNSLLNLNCRRGQQYNGLDGQDVVGWDGVHIECKRVEKLNIDKAMEQSVQDAQGNDVPVVCHRKNNGPWMLTVRLDDLERFLTR